MKKIFVFLLFLPMAVSYIDINKISKGIKNENFCFIC